MKIGCLTFHAAYNFGSVLQAYALQEFIKNEYECDYTIINFRSKPQKEFYKTWSKYNSISRNVFNLLFFGKLTIKAKKFEDFINNKLQVSDEIRVLSEKDFGDYDVLIVGGDQPWNMECIDYSDSYFIPYELKNKKLVSYGISMGGFNPNTEKDVNFLKNQLLKFDRISVREEDTKFKIEKLYKKDIFIHFDPIFLLPKSIWEERFCLKDINLRKKFIFVYMLKVDNEVLKQVKKFAKKNHFQVILSRPTSPFDIISASKLMYESGPIDFLRLIYNAELIVTSSFHGCAFSSLFNKKFFAVNGKNDKRISYFLKKNNLESLAIDKSTDLDNAYVDLENINFDVLNQNIRINIGNVVDYFNKVIR